jgi:hypothetical protein
MQKAERIATEIFDAIHDNVATKADLQRVEATLTADLRRIEAALKADIELVRHQLITRLGGLVVAVVGVLFAELHYWPPHP